MRKELIYTALLLVAALLQFCNTDNSDSKSILPAVNIVSSSRAIIRGSGSFSVSARLDTISRVRVVVPFSVTGTAVAPLNHNCISDSFVFLPGDTVKELTYNVNNDASFSGYKTVVITLTATPDVTVGEYATDSITIAYDTIVNYQLPDNTPPGWTQSPFESDYKIVTGEDLYTIINGGATPYIEEQYQQALRQIMTSTTDQSLTLMAMFFPSPANTDSLFFRKTRPESVEDENIFTTPLEGFSADNVIGTPVIGGMMYIMRFNDVYFELTISGFSSSEAAVSSAIAVTNHLVQQLPAR